MDILGQYRDSDGYIRLQRKNPYLSLEPQKPSLKIRFSPNKSKEIILRHGHIAITDYHMGDNWEFEKFLSVWDKRCRKNRKQYGIHTIELYAKSLTYTDVQKVIDHLAEDGSIQILKADPYNTDRYIKSTHFVSRGVRLRIYQSYDNSNGIGFIINPSTLLSGKYQPVKLWKPTPESVENMLECLSKIMEEMTLESVRPEELSLSQIDLTTNIWYDEQTDITRVIRQFWKGMIPRGFKRHITKDNATRQHSFMMKNKTISLKAYDKIYELMKYNRCPEMLCNESVLRVELSLKREAFLKKLKMERSAPLREMLLAGYKNGPNMITNYLKKLHPCGIKEVSYEEAKRRIEKNICDSKLRNQMLYLLEKASDCAGLDSAVSKLKKRYMSIDNRRVNKLFLEFKKLDISPITSARIQ